MLWIIDLDGVVWLGDQPIAGSAEAIALLRHRGERVLFVSNNSSPTISEYRDKLNRMGIATREAEIVTSADAAATLLEPESTALACAGPGVIEALERRGVTWVRDGDATTVVVGWHRDFDFDRLTAASRAVRRGARLIGTNDDPTYPTPEGLLPGCGAIVAAVSTASSTAAEIAGKPHEAMIALVLRRGAFEPHNTIVIGDRPSTDGLLARRLGARFGLVLSSVTPTDEPRTEINPDRAATDLATLVADELGGRTN